MTIEKTRGNIGGHEHILLCDKFYLVITKEDRLKKALDNDLLDK